MITTDYFTEDGLVKQVGLSSDWWENIVIKELIDNALDAVEPLPEKNVEINYSNGNFSVFDNGSGIPAEQVPLAFLRHATSKIRSVEELVQIASLGFRGEALSSISAVAQIEMITKTPDALTGTRYVIEGQ